MKSLAILAVALMSQAALACSEFMWQWNADDWRTKPDAIYHGKIVAVRAPGSYARDGETDSLTDTFSQRSLPRSIDIKIFEVLKGRERSFLRVTLQPCVGGLPDYLDEVVLFKVGSVWHAKLLIGDNPESNPIADSVLRALSRRVSPNTSLERTRER